MLRIGQTEDTKAQPSLGLLLPSTAPSGMSLHFSGPLGTSRSPFGPPASGLCGAILPVHTSTALAQLGPVPAQGLGLASAEKDFRAQPARPPL